VQENEELEIPELTGAEMVEVDRAMVEDFGIDLTRMMENAGRALALLARARFFDCDVTGHRVAVLAGSGGNGGGGLVCARRLSAWGADVEVHVSRPAGEIAGVPGEQLAMLQHMGVPLREPGDVADVPDLDGVDLVIDALIGYSLHGAPRGAVLGLIDAANLALAPVLSLDVPSGLDSTSGETPGVAVIADATMTLALPKIGLSAPTAQSLVGELYLADIGVPPALYARPPLNLAVGPIFARQEVIQLR
jgi:NAD(P)H-hydrate epimerase